jgi:uncharacterized membrane protein YraQ (UPF0718 family)
MELALNLLVEFWKVVREMAPFLLLGFFLAGLFHVLVPASWVVNQLGGRGWWPVIKAALIGIPVPLCSCGILPVAAQLRRAGASRGSTASFLISGPETDIDNIVITWGVMGPMFSIYRVIVSLVNSIAAGLLIDRFGGAEPPVLPSPAASCCSAEKKEDGPDGGCCSSHGAEPPLQSRSFWAVLLASLRYGFVTLPRDLGGSLLVGLLIAAVLTIAGQWLLPLLRGADPVYGILGAMLLGLPMYVCSTSSIPIAASLVFNAGLTPGAALAFMIAGPATNAAAVSLLWKLLGPRSTMIYLGTIALTAFGAGVLLDKVFMPPGHAFCANCHIPAQAWMLDLLGVAMLVILTMPLLARLLARSSNGTHHIPSGTAQAISALQPVAACAHGPGCTCHAAAPGGLKLKRRALNTGQRKPGE